MWEFTATVTGVVLGALLVMAGVECYIRERMLNRRLAASPPYEAPLNGEASGRSEQETETAVAESFDIIIIGSGPGGYVTAIRAAQLGFKTAVVERDFLGGICSNWGCIPTKALLRSAEIYHYMQHAKDYGLKADNVGFDAAAVVKRSRGVAGRMNAGVGFLMKKNKISVIWGEASDRRARQDHGEGQQDAGAEGRARAGRLSGQAHHRRDRRAAARAAGARARQEAGLDLFRGDEPGQDAEVAAGGRLRRHRHRVRVVLPHHGRRGDRGRGAAADPAGRGRRDRGVRAQGSSRSRASRS